MKRYILVLFLCFGGLPFLQGQHVLRRAQLAYEGGNYKYSVFAFQRYYNKHEKVKPETVLYLAKNYYHLQDYAKAKLYFEEIDQESYEAVDFLYYGEVLAMYKEYDQALAMFDAGLSMQTLSDDVRSLMTTSKASVEWAIENSDWYDFPDVKVSPTKLPVTGQSFGVCATDDKLIFSSVDVGKRYVQDDGRGRAIIDLAYSSKEENEYETVYDYSKNLTTNTNVGAIDLTPDGQRIYYTKEIRKRKGYMLKLFTAEFDGESQDWVREVELPFCDDEYDYVHPAVSLDGKTLFFASNMKGSVGGMDIFSCEITGPTTWGEPISLGDVINTPRNELFPNVSPDGILSFSSNGHYGFGGLDVYWAIKSDGTYIVENAGTPLNSSWDDFANEMDPSVPLKSYVSTNRTFEGKYDEVSIVYFPESYFDDLALMQVEDLDELAEVREERSKAKPVVVEPPVTVDPVVATVPVVVPLFVGDTVSEPVEEIVEAKVEEINVDVVKSTIVDVIMSQPIVNSSYVLYSKIDGSELYSASTGADGSVSIDMAQLGVDDNEMVELVLMNANANYTKYSLSLKSSKLRLYNMNNPIFVTPLLEEREEIEDVVVANEKTTGGAAFAYGEKTLTQEGQYYLDSWVDFLKKNPKKNIKLMTHTDQRGSVAVNFNLSQQRAFEAKRYLISHGISHMRILARGYGERYPVVDCQNCDEADHAANRRIEIEIFTKKQTN